MPFNRFSAAGHPARTSSLSPSKGPSRPTKLSWEEPHPGQRFMTEATAQSWAQRHAGAGAAGEFKNGMAAKGYHDHRGHRYRIQRSFTRRDIRVRRHVKAPMRRVEAHDAKSTGPGCSLVNVEALPGSTAEAQRRVSVDADGDTATITDGDTATITDAGTEAEVATIVTEQTIVPPYARPYGALGDVSNLLGICEDEDDYRPATALDPSALRAGPCKDMYGWEQVLDRKVPDGQRKDSPALHSLATSVRRSNQGARRLIQRVFSYGSSSGDEFSPGRRASTAN
ncbi:hypothetical protein IMZ48_36560 [Candidatus Bathyarchaeota archaeon]|nr:hypothetical protein [Candidatus Bathyarchaeota archaeon]